MRVMTGPEMEDLIRGCKWATICTVTPDGEPYAIEATPFMLDGNPCFMISPHGGTWKNMRHNTAVLLKYTRADEDLRHWAGVSCKGRGEFVTDPDAQREGWRLLGQVMGTDYSRAAERFARCRERSPLFRVHVEQTTGRCSGA